MLIVCSIFVLLTLATLLVHGWKLTLDLLASVLLGSFLLTLGVWLICQPLLEGATVVVVSFIVGFMWLFASIMSLPDKTERMLAKRQRAEKKRQQQLEDAYNDYVVEWNDTPSPAQMGIISVFDQAVYHINTRANKDVN